MHEIRHDVAPKLKPAGGAPDRTTVATAPVAGVLAAPATQATGFPDALHYVRHEFDILGSGWRRVHYGMAAPGFLGQNYSDVSMSWERLLGSMQAGARAEAERIMAIARALVPNYEAIDWHIDFKSGYRSELRPAHELGYGLVEGVDLKVMADMSRGYALPHLAIAWRETKDVRFRHEVLAQMMDWLAANPAGMGPGWRANMNVAIRAVNWIATLELLFDASSAPPTIEQEALTLIEGSLRTHLHHIAANLEFPEGHFHPNHYIANLVGLLLVALRVKDKEPSAGAWERLVWRELRIEMQRRIGDDGVDFEASTAYHAFVLEMLATGLLLAARRCGQRTPSEQRAWLEQRFGEKCLAQLHGMFAVLQALTPPSGMVPLVGDNDSGRLVYLETPRAGARDWRFLSCIGATVFEDPSLLPEGCRPEHWSAARRLTQGSVLETPASAERDSAFPTVGFYVLRGGGAYVLVSAGSIGTDGLGGHAHNDRLAFTLEIEGVEFLVDPGVFVYTASLAERNAGRSVLNHNTLAVARQEQNRWLDSSKWWGCHEDTRCKCVAWEATAEKTYFVGEHHGYRRLVPPITHRRILELTKATRQLALRDEILAPASAAIPELLWTFVLHPACRLQTDQGFARIQRLGKEIRLRASQGEWMLQDAFYSPAYGVREATQALRLSRDPGVAEQSFLISW